MRVEAQTGADARGYGQGEKGEPYGLRRRRRDAIHHLARLWNADRGALGRVNDHFCHQRLRRGLGRGRVYTQTAAARTTAAPPTNQGVIDGEAGGSSIFAS